MNCQSSQGTPVLVSVQNVNSGITNSDPVTQQQTLPLMFPHPPPMLLPSPFALHGPTNPSQQTILPASMNFSIPPPGWVPPSVQLTAEKPPSDLWIENKSSEGKAYYYNAQTRETTWTRPAVANIITQEEFEKSLSNPNFKSIEEEECKDVEIQKKATAQEDHIVESDKKDDVLSDASNNEECAESVSGKKEEVSTNAGVDENKPCDYTPPAIVVLPPPVMPINANMHSLVGPPPPWLVAPGGKPIPPPWWPVNFANQAALIASVAPSNDANIEAKSVQTSTQDELEKMEAARKDHLATVDSLKQTASEWTKHTSPEGREYFYSSKSMQSQWTKPQALTDLEEGEVKLRAMEANLSILRAKTSVEIANSITAEISKTEEQKSLCSMQSDQISEEEQARLRNRPVSNIPVPGSPWCVVWTANARVFFFNPTHKLSVWERPVELQGRPDVDKLTTEAPPEVQAIVAQKRKADALEDTNDHKKSKLPGGDNAQNGADDDLTIEASKEGALEAELKASKERSQIPYELRATQFKAMLLEKGVSAFSTWEKELHKIVFDRRYLLLASKERKAVFDKFVKERADEERVEKAMKIRRIRDDFKDLLKETVIKSNMVFSEFASRNGKDERFRAIEKMRDRETLFNDYITKLRKRERDDRYNDMERLRKNFWDLLREKCVGGASAAGCSTRWSDVRRCLESDSRYRAVESTSRREDWFKEFVREHRDMLRGDKRDERQARIDASIRKRQEEVKEQLSESLRDREKEREQLRKGEAVENFQVLLMDMVRTVDNDWKQTKRVLKKDCRWDLCKLLGKEEKEKLFDQHISALIKKKTDAFYQLLDETEEVTLTSKWKTVKKVIKSDIRYERFAVSDKAKEKGFANYIKDKYNQAKEELRQLLAETRFLTHKTLSQVRDNEQAMRDTEDVLAKDKRFITLDCVPEERRKILLDFLSDLEARGPLPPPTASEPNRR